MKLNLLWLIFTVGLALIQPLTSAELCHKQDKAILLKIKNAFKNPYVLVSWDPQTDCCNWNLVSCDETTHRITSVGIHSEGLSGKIPVELAQIPYLDTLILTRQPKLVGPIPAAIGTIKGLKTLMISGTSITGPIPEFISGLKGLTFLDLSANKFSGHIPASLATLPLLGGLHLDKNELSGPIPASFANFKVKKDMYMYLAHNKLSGPIPASFVKSDFAVFDASHNLLTGDASPMFGEGKGADTVDLSRNRLSFDLSKVKFSARLGTLDLSHNMITGYIPASLTHSKGLHGLDLSFNRLCGRIPTGGILQGFKATSFVNNKCLCGLPLAVPCKK